jgi:hypothetical protein
LTSPVQFESDASSIHEIGKSLFHEEPFYTAPKASGDEVTMQGTWRDSTQDTISALDNATLPIRVVEQWSESRSELMSPKSGIQFGRTSASRTGRSPNSPAYRNQSRRKPPASTEANDHAQIADMPLTGQEHTPSSSTSGGSSASRDLEQRRPVDSRKPTVEAESWDEECRWRIEDGVFHLYNTKQFIRSQAEFPINQWVYSEIGWEGQGKRKWVIQRSPSHDFEYSEDPE